MARKKEIIAQCYSALDKFSVVSLRLPAATSTSMEDPAFPCFAWIKYRPADSLNKGSGAVEEGSVPKK
jgi:hypothetical protein